MVAAAIRDIAIIIIAIQSIVIGVLLAVLVWQVWRLVKMLQSEVQPIIRDAQDTVSTVRGTTSFVSDKVVEPVVKTSSTLIGMRRTVSSLTADLRPKRKPKKPITPPVA
ncbi:MAG: hypothetical protein KDE19_14385 [Caldilineaceae bacterium]|nr:hypothetical protein [Caldilineaceae bacterium]